MHARPAFLAVAAALVIGLLAVGVAPAAALADGTAPAPAGNITIKSMDVSLRPEYDTTDALVVYDFALTNTGTDPYSGEIRFHVPPGATNQVHICEQENGNKHAVCRPYNTVREGDQDLFTWTPSKPIAAGGTYPIYVEYYYNPIRGDSAKTVDFLYHPSYAVQQLNMEVAQPARSADFKLDPGAASTYVASDGLTYYDFKSQNLTPDKPLEVKLSYTKPDAKPSIARTTAASAAAKGGSNTTAAVVAGLVVAAFAGMMFFGMRGGSSAALATRGGSRSVRRTQRTSASPAARPQAGATRSNSVGSRKAEPSRDPGEAEEMMRLARQRLLEGRISEETYRAIIKDITRDLL